MADIVSPEVRRRMMSNIRGKNTKPELVLRSGLHRLGFRFRLHDKNLSGKPDIVFPRFHAVIFVNGCFWHGHECHLFKWPSTREQFWRSKITRNRELDEHNMKRLQESGWRVGVVWECVLKGKYRKPEEEIIKTCAEWLRSDSPFFEIESANDKIQ